MKRYSFKGNNVVAKNSVIVSVKKSGRGYLLGLDNGFYWFLSNKKAKCTPKVGDTITSYLYCLTSVAGCDINGERQFRAKGFKEED